MDGIECCNKNANEIIDFTIGEVGGLFRSDMGKGEHVRVVGN